MARWRPDGEAPEVLSHGPEGHRVIPASAWLGVLCLVAGVVIGVKLEDAQRARDPVLTAGVIQLNPDRSDDRRFAVPLHNGGSAEVTVRSVVAAGWVVPDGRLRPVPIRPGRWVMVPLLVHIDCRVVAADPRPRCRSE